MRHLLAVFALLVLTAPALRAENAVTAKQLTVEPPTLICLGFEWDLTGDDNRNATVEVSYRLTGQSVWQEALPLLRMGGEKIFRAPYTVPNKFAGSILDPRLGESGVVRRASDQQLLRDQGVWLRARHRPQRGGVFS